MQNFINLSFFDVMKKGNNTSLKFSFFTAACFHKIHIDVPRGLLPLILPTSQDLLDTSSLHYM